MQRLHWGRVSLSSIARGSAVSRGRVLTNAATAANPSDLGLQSRLNQGRFEMMFRLKKRNKLRVDFLDVDRTATHQLAETIKHRALVVVISDLFDDADRLVEALKHFRHKKHEVIVFHILDDDEMTFPFADLTRFEGLELEPTLIVDPRGVREEYLHHFHEFCERLERGCREMQIDVLRMNTRDNPAPLLATYLARRMKRY